MIKRVRRVLFVCTGNIDRSPTAEAFLRRKEGFEAQSAGTWINAPMRLTASLIDWADIIFAMEEQHRETILALRLEAKDKIIVLGIPNEYQKDDLELIKILKRKLTEHLKIEW